jgi:hypothetical protein
MRLPLYCGRHQETATASKTGTSAASQQQPQTHAEPGQNTKSGVRVKPLARGPDSAAVDREHIYLGFRTDSEGTKVECGCGWDRLVRRDLPYPKAAGEAEEAWKEHAARL